MTDDVKALAERLRTNAVRYSLPMQVDMLAAADMLDRLAPQREDVIDREASARIIEWIDDLDKYGSLDKAFYLDLKRRLNAIIRSLPSREAIIEAVKAKIGSHMSDRLVDLKPEMDALRIMRDVTELVELRSAPVFKATQNTAESDPFVRLDCAGADTVAAQPRSNSVEDGVEKILAEQKAPAFSPSSDPYSERNSPQKAVIDTEQSGHAPSQEVK